MCSVETLLYSYTGWHIMFVDVFFGCCTPLLLEARKLLGEMAGLLRILQRFSMLLTSCYILFKFFEAA